MTEANQPEKQPDNDLLKEIVGLAGIAFFVAGVALISVPAALIVLGLLLFGYAYLTLGLPLPWSNK